jgi:hypothetical protein
MKRKRLTPTKFEIETLREICRENDCDMEMLIDALMNNIVSEQLSIQIYYIKTGELPQ